MKGTILSVERKIGGQVGIKNSKSGKSNFNMMDPRLSKEDSKKLADELEAAIGKETDIKVGPETINGQEVWLVKGLGVSERKGGGSYGGGKPYVRDPAESRRIVMQNAMGHATAIALHNAALTKSAVSVDAVIATATLITDVIMTSDKTTTVLKEDDSAIVEQETLDEVAF